MIGSRVLIAMLRSAGLAVLALALSASMASTAADAGPRLSLPAAPDEGGALSPAGWTFFGPCGPEGATRAGDGPPACGPLALADPTLVDGDQPGTASSGFAIARAIDSGPPLPPAERPNHLLGALLAGTSLGVAAATSFTDDSPRGFHFSNEGWFGADTYAGGADKASHFVLPAILAKELARVYARLGYSETQAHLMSFAVASVSGLVTEIGDGTTGFGFSYEDLLMDIFGAGAATLISAAGVDDLVGFRWGFLLPISGDTCCKVKGLGGDYSNYIYTADLKLAGVGRRLGLEIGPLRYLLLSVTYGTKGYPSGLPEDRERRVGFEVGLNLAEILSDLGARRNTWWGYALQLVGENLRVPYTAGGLRYDMNRGRWIGPTTR
jgi:hypothetical protein